MKKISTKRTAKGAVTVQPSDALALVRKSIAVSLPDMEGAEGAVHTKVSTAPAQSIIKMSKFTGTELLQQRQAVVHTVNLRKIVKAGDGTPLLRLVRARVDDEGKVLKIATSR